MSTGGKMEVTCACGHRFEDWIWQSVNVTASPELKEAILEGRMNVVRCPSCGKRFHVETPFLYHDIETREYIWVYPRAEEARSRKIHENVIRMWENVKAKVSSPVRDVFEREYDVIVLFGMDRLVLYLKGCEAGGVHPPSSN
jgi:hypothetical protein